jgi:cell division protein FtsI (penicillin-binding protein 3)
VFLLESQGLRVLISGNGKVKEQSIPAGAPVIKGSIITLSLQS